VRNTSINLETALFASFNSVSSACLAVIPKKKELEGRREEKETLECRKKDKTRYGKEYFLGEI
jgi:hypothetical protein